MYQGSPSPFRADLIGALCALLALAPVHAAPGEPGSGSKARPAAAPPPADLDLAIDPPELTPPPSAKSDKVETLDPKAAAKAKAEAKAERAEARSKAKEAKAAEKAEKAEPKPDEKAESAAARPKKVPTADAPWLEKSKATLELTCKTEGATVFFDGKELGKTPLEPVRVLPGMHELMLTKEGLADSLRTLRLKPGAKLKVTVELRPPPALAAGQAPPPLQVEVVDDETKAEEEEAAPPPLITAGGDLTGPGLQLAPPPKPAPAQALNAEAPPQPKPLLKQWWLWGGAAAAAVVLAAAVVYALPPQYVEKRDPAAACGGACGVVVNK